MSVPAILVALIVLLFVHEPSRGAKEKAVLRKVQAMVICDADSSVVTSLYLTFPSYKMTLSLANVHTLSYKHVR